MRHTWLESASCLLFLNGTLYIELVLDTCTYQRLLQLCFSYRRPHAQETMKQEAGSDENRGYQQHYYYNPQQQPEESAPLQGGISPQQQPQASAPPYYGTFQGNLSYPQPGYPSQPDQYGYQTVQGYPIIEPRPVDTDLPPLPCCGLGIGWCLFIIGWFLASIPWYAGAIMLFCTRPDPRVRMGLICCTIAAILSLIAAIVGGTTAKN
eukprot:c15258_g1_i1 orf=76-699(+)